MSQSPLAVWGLSLSLLLLAFFAGTSQAEEKAAPTEAAKNPWAAENLDFEQGKEAESTFPKMWRGGGGGYEVSLDTNVFHSGKASGKIARKPGEEGSFGVLNMQLPAEPKLAGQKLRISGFLKFEGVSGFAGLWLRGNRPTGQPPAFYNMQDKNLRGSSDWKEYSFEIELPADVDRVNLGAMLVGDGVLWVDKIRLEIIGVSSPNSAQPANSAETRQAVLEAKAEADAWLALIDAEKIKESWEKTAPFLQNSISSEKWLEEVPKARKPLGKPVMRNLKQAKYLNSLPGAPDGKYVLIQYETDFESKAAAEESITMAVCPDGKWKPAGYFIR